MKALFSANFENIFLPRAIRHISFSECKLAMEKKRKCFQTIILIKKTSSLTVREQSKNNNEIFPAYRLIKSCQN